MTDRYDELRAALDVALLDLDAAAMPTKSEVFIRCGTGAADLRDAINAVTSERDSLLAALKPFAALADTMHQACWTEDRPLDLIDYVDDAGVGYEPELRAGDFMRAAALTTKEG